MQVDYIIYTDGGARGNPGPAGAGVVIYDSHENILAEDSVFLGTNTNNYAEYKAIIIGLKLLKKLVNKNERKEKNVEIRTDSQLIARQLNREYQIKDEKLFPHFIEINNILVADFPNTKFVHIGREKNKEADQLANRAMDKKS